MYEVMKTRIARCSLSKDTVDPVRLSEWLDLPSKQIRSVMKTKAYQRILETEREKLSEQQVHRTLQRNQALFYSTVGNNQTGFYSALGI